MKRILPLAVAVLLGGHAWAGESAYTKLDLDKDCVFHSSYEQGGSAYCQGYKGYPVHFSEGDLRQMVRFGHLAKLEGQWESFGNFNRINDTIEWRLKDAKPYAAILRWFLEVPDDQGNFTPQSNGQVLVVSTVASHENPTSCVVGYVDAKANKNANDLAREIADTLAPQFRCGSDTPRFSGVPGKFSDTASSSFE
jgi:hypothetical protein